MAAVVGIHGRERIQVEACKVCTEVYVAAVVHRPALTGPPTNTTLDRVQRARPTDRPAVHRVTQLTLFHPPHPHPSSA